MWYAIFTYCTPKSGLIEANITVPKPTPSALGLSDTITSHPANVLTTQHTSYPNKRHTHMPTHDGQATELSNLFSLSLYTPHPFPEFHLPIPLPPSSFPNPLDIKERKPVPNARMTIAGPHN